MSKTPLLATASGTYQATSEEGSSIRIGDFKNGMQKIQQHIHNASSCGICKNDIGKACLVCQQLTQASACPVVIGNCAHVFHEHCQTSRFKNHLKDCLTCKTPFSRALVCYSL